MVILGYVLFGLAGAIAAGVAALLVGNGIEQSTRRRFEQAVAFAEEDVSAAMATAATAEQSGDLFSDRESATGQADRALEAADDVSAKILSSGHPTRFVGATRQAVLLKAGLSGIVRSDAIDANRRFSRILSTVLMLLTSFRSLLRNRRRSIASALAIGFGCIAILLSTGFVEWIYFAIRESAIQTGLGHVQIAAPGYWAEGATDPSKFLVQGVPPGVETLARDPRVKAIAPRLQFNGLAVVGETSLPFLALGIDPAVEENISGALRTVDGEKLSGPDAAEALLGKGLATALGVKQGDTVVLITSTPAGGVNAAEVVVRGTFAAEVKAVDDTALRVPIGLARTLTRLNGTHMWAVALKNTTMTDAFAADAARTLAGSGLDFRPWYALADFYNKTRELFQSQMNFVVLIIGAIVVLVISNLMIMNVLERTGEIGTMLALGTPRREVLRGFLVEGLILGVSASALGIILGVALSALISSIGIPMPPPPGRQAGYSGEILLTSGGVALAFVVGVVAATIASVYPAWTASKLQIVDALRHNR